MPHLNAVEMRTCTSLSAANKRPHFEIIADMEERCTGGHETIRVKHAGFSDFSSLLIQDTWFPGYY